MAPPHSAAEYMGFVSALWLYGLVKFVHAFGFVAIFAGVGWQLSVFVVSS